MTNQLLVACLLLSATSARPDDFVKKLTNLQTLRLNVIITCAIPLKEIHAGNGQDLDHMTPKAVAPAAMKIDEGIKHLTPIPVCPSQ